MDKSLFTYELFITFVSVRVSQTSKAMQTTAIRTVAYSLPENKVILLTLLISRRYISYTEFWKLWKRAKSGVQTGCCCRVSLDDDAVGNIQPELGGYQNCNY